MIEELLTREQIRRLCPTRLQQSAAGLRCRVDLQDGTIVGGYLAPYWFPYVFSAYHVRFDDGREATIFAKFVHVQEYRRRIAR